MPASRVSVNLVCFAALAAAVAGCSNATEVFKTDQWFTQPLSLGTRSDGSSAVVNKNFDLAPRGPVSPDELVSADGRCSAPMAEAPQGSPQPPSEPAVGSVAGDLAGSPMPAGTQANLDPGVPQIAGGIALGMSECDAVRRAGVPANVNIGAGDNNDRRVVLTYLAGPWPGIYTFQAGRLKEVSAAPVQPKPAAKPAAKKKPVAAAKPRATQPTQIR